MVFGAGACVLLLSQEFPKSLALLQKLSPTPLRSVGESFCNSCHMVVDRERAANQTNGPPHVLSLGLFYSADVASTLKGEARRPYQAHATEQADEPRVTKVVAVGAARSL